MKQNDTLSAVHILTQVLRGRPLVEAINGQDPAVATPRVRAWTFGVCRHYFSLSERLAHVSKIPLKKLDMDVFATLLVGLFQLTQSSRKPYAVVSEAVDTVKHLHKGSATGFVNALLRQSGKPFESKSLSARYELPEWLIESIQASYSPVESERIFTHINCQAPQTLRVNQRKIDPQAFQQALNEAKIKFEELGDACTLRINQPQPTASLPGYEEGRFVAQDANAQIPVKCLDLAAGQRVLDACAAPGNKAFQILEYDVELTALDNDAHRCEWSKTTGQRLGMPLAIQVADASSLDWWDGKPFDRILIDAPCSATGIIARNPDIKIHRQADQLSDLVANQLALLESLWKTLAVRGKLVYCTCSLLPDENEKVIEAFLAEAKDAHADPLVDTIDLSCNLISRSIGVQTLPDPNRGDGFYIAKLSKMAPAS